MKQTRDMTIDIVKFIGIVLVVFAHTVTNESLHNIIYCFHMPLFFIISGMTFFYSYRNKYTVKEFIKKKLKTIMIPYFIFLTLSFLYWITIERRFRANQNVDMIGNFFNIFFCFIKSEWYEANIVMWFLPCLFSSEVIFFIINDKIKNIKSFWIAIIGITIIGFVLNNYKIFLPWGIETAFLVQIFLASGYYINKYKIYEVKNTFKMLTIITAITILVIAINMNNNVSMLEHMYKNQLMFILGAFSGTNLVIILSTYIKSLIRKTNNIIIYLGSNSLVIMMCHEPIKRIVIKIISILFRENAEIVRSNICIAIAITILTIVIIVPIIKILEKFFPISIGRKYIKNSM